MDTFFSNDAIMDAIEGIMFPERIRKLRASTTNERMIKKAMISNRMNTCSKFWPNAATSRDIKSSVTAI